MKFVQVDTLPKMRSRHNLQNFIEEFMNSDIEIAKVDFNEMDYKSDKVCYSCLRLATKRYGHRIKVSLREGEVFLSKWKPED